MCNRLISEAICIPCYTEGEAHQALTDPERSMLATWVIRSIVGYPRQSVVYIFILSNQLVILETNETPVSGVKLYQGDRGSNLAA